MATYPGKGNPLEVSGQMSVEDGFRAIVAHCMEQMQEHQPDVARGGNAESVHQMRVGTRRLRSATRLFGRRISFPADLLHELTWLAGELGAARDADVLADTTLPRVIEACPHETGLLALEQLARETAEGMRREAATAVSSGRYALFMLGLTGWLEASGWRDGLDESVRSALAEPLKRRARHVSRRRHEKLIAHGRRLVHGEPDERHQVRIAAKKVRYAAEFFQSLQPAGRVTRYLRRLVALQDGLGRLNDAAVADRLLRDIQDTHPELAVSASFARGYLDAAAKQDLLAVDRLWARFESVKRL